MHTPVTVLYAAWAPFYSGAERALVVLLEHLDRARYSPVVVLGTEGVLADEMRSRNIPVHVIPLVNRSVRGIAAWSASIARLVWRLRQAGATIVHSNDVPSFQPVGYAARLGGVPAVTHVRFPDTNRGFGWFLKPGFARALFVSQYLRDDAVAEAPAVFGGRNEVVYDGVEIPPPATDADRSALRDELGLPRERRLVVMAGQVSEVKGIWDYLEAAAILSARGAPATFVVLGDDLKNNGAVRLEAERRVRERGLDGTIKFLGFRPDARRLIPAFDIVAVPSHVEPLGNATLEAMAAARPVVGARVGGIPEMICERETGLMVSSKVPEELAVALDRLIADPDLSRVYGLAGRARATAQFSVEAHARHVGGIYDRVFAAQGQPVRERANR